MVGNLFYDAFSVTRPAFLNIFTLEEPLKYFSGLREPLHKNYYIYSSRYGSVISKL
jgi:hypothetical protein